MKTLLLFIYFLNIQSLRTLKFLDLASPCKINSHVIAVENIRTDKYDLLISLSTNQECKLTCSLMNDEISSMEMVIGHIKNNPVITQTDSYDFYGRHYYFYRVSDLQSFINYKYKCGVDDPQFSQTYEIKFPKNNLTQTKILTFGDWSKHKNGLKTFELLTKNVDYNKYDAFVTLGDYSYNMGDRDDPTWDQGNIFFDWIQPVSSKIPFMMNAGNHEYIKHDFEQYIKRFFMPNKNATENLYYSFDINDVHFVSVTSEFGLISYRTKEYYEQFKNWLTEDLKNTNKKWRIVYMHRPLYCSWSTKPRCSDEAHHLRDFFEDLFYEGKVDLILSGHLHNYERMFPIYKNQVDTESLSKDMNVYTNPKYPVHLVCGTGGNREGASDLCK
jgi:acid phosphatase type 7